MLPPPGAIVTPSPPGASKRLLGSLPSSPPGVIFTPSPPSGLGFTPTGATAGGLLPPPGAIVTPSPPSGLGFTPTGATAGGLLPPPGAIVTPSPPGASACLPESPSALGRRIASTGPPVFPVQFLSGTGFGNFHQFSGNK